MRATLFCLLVLAVPAAAQQLPADRLAAIEAATVFLKVTAPDVSGSGTGFVVRRTADAAYIVTNYHVACPFRERCHRPGEANTAQIKAVFQSGSPNEWERPAVLVAEDPARDLAVLKVTGGKFPAPLALADPDRVTRTLSVQVCGFPFGDQLTAGAKHPGLTIGPGQVSGFTREPNGRMKHVQLTAAINPGNSGGPVVASADGEVVGVAVLRIRDAGIGMAVPIRDVRTLLDGRLGAPELAAGTAATGQTVVRVEVPVIDPYGLVTEVKLTAKTAPSGEKLTATDSNGRYVPLAGTSVSLKVADGWATGTVSLPRDGNPSLWVQLTYWTGKDEYLLPATDHPLPASSGTKATPFRALTPTPSATTGPKAGPTLMDVSKTPEQFIGKRVTFDAVVANTGRGTDLDVRYDPASRPANLRFTAAKSLAEQVRAAVGTDKSLSVRVSGTVLAADGDTDKRPVLDIDEVTPLAADGSPKGTLRAVAEPVATPEPKPEPPAPKVEPKPEPKPEPPPAPTPAPVEEPVAEPAPAKKGFELPIIPAVAAGVVGVIGFSLVMLRGRKAA